MPMTQECGSLTFFEKAAEWKNVTVAIESPTLSSSSCLSQVSDDSGDEVVSQEFILLDTTPCSNANRYLPIAGQDESTFSASKTSTLESIACLEKTCLSQVHLAYDTELNEKVVIKQVSDNDTFLHELSILTRLSALSIPHCVLLKDKNIQKRKFVFPVLNKLATSMDLVQVARTMKQLMLALSLLHKNAIAHLDITASNIMMNASNELVLIDFGLSRRFTSKKNDYHPQGRGTMGYMAPEMLAGEAIQGTPDVYSAGVVFGQLLQPYISDPSLQYLGSKLVRPSTTTHISMRLREIIDEQSFKNSHLALNMECCANEEWTPILLKAADLLSNMLDSDTRSRISASEALAHPFLTADESEFSGMDLESVQSRKKRTYACMYPSKKESVVIRYR